MRAQSVAFGGHHTCYDIEVDLRRHSPIYVDARAADHAVGTAAGIACDSKRGRGEAPSLLPTQHRLLAEVTAFRYLVIFEQ